MRRIFPALLILFLLTVLLPVIILGAVLTRAVFNLKIAKNNLLQGQFAAAGILAQQSKNDFTLAKKFWPPFLPVRLAKSFDWLLLGETGADVIIHAANIGPEVMTLIKDSRITPQVLDRIKLDLAAIDQDLGLVSAETDLLVKLGLKLNPRELRKTVGLTRGVLTAFAELGFQDKKFVYLVVFQNSTELRPTGGFIGSYGLVSLENGRLANLQINDVYAADGQLRGTVPPPDEILHFLGQPAWYLRDANFDPDFSLTAKRLIWFLEKETGQKVDGVIAVNLGLAQKILAATGPLTLPDQNLTVTADNFFQKTEEAAEINFFPGSNQKKDFLGAVASQLLTKITTGNPASFLPLARALLVGLNEKDVLFNFNLPTAQKVFETNNWAGRMAKDTDLAIVEANFGANKTNYFLERKIQTKIIIDKNGSQDVQVAVRYRNNSPAATWPGGPYKNYLRFYVPAGSQLLDFNLNDGRKMKLSSLLTAEELAKTDSSQFFVFQKPGGDFTSFGTLITVPVLAEKIVAFSYRLPNKLNLNQAAPVFNFRIWKQPGTGADPWDLAVVYPSSLKPQGQTRVAFPQELIYNGNLSQDGNYEISFVKS